MFVLFHHSKYKVNHVSSAGRFGSLFYRVTKKNVVPGKLGTHSVLVLKCDDIYSGFVLWADLSDRIT